MKKSNKNPKFTVGDFVLSDDFEVSIGKVISVYEKINGIGGNFVYLVSFKAFGMGSPMLDLLKESKLKELKRDY